MSQRYRRERMRNGMVAAPDALNQNQNEYAGEVNGYLDRENIPQDAITEAKIVAGTFTRYLSDPKTDTITLDPTSQEWQNGDATTADPIHAVSDTLAYDAHVHVEWSGGIEWAAVTTGDAIRVRITINGIEVATTGFISARRVWSAPALSGDLPQQAGPIDVVVQAMAANITQEIPSPGIFAIDGGITNDVSLTDRELLVEIRSR